MVRAQIKAGEADNWERHEHWLRAWHLSLSVANGAALLGVSTLILNDAAKDYRVAFIIAAWWFFTGVIAGGLIPLLTALRSRAAIKLSEEALKLIDKAVVTGVPLTELKRFGRDVAILRDATPVLEWVSAIAFVAGLVGPLLAITFVR